jgi:thioredoxin reductase/ferredoxin
MNFIARYTRWLHTRWPAGHVEKLPKTREDGSTNVPGMYVVGDLRGIPLLKFSADTGARAVQRMVADPAFQAERGKGGDRAKSDMLELAIIGAGVAGMAAALEARKHALRFRVYEGAEPFSTIVNFPKAKPIYTYPKEMKPAGDLAITAQVKEPLVEELRAQTIEKGIVPEMARVERVRRKDGALEVVFENGSVMAQRVIVALGRSGNFRMLGVPGEHLDKVFNRLHDPKDFAGRRVLVVGGGDTAIETAIALALCGSEVTVSYRKNEFARPKPENLEKLRMLEANPQAPDVAVEEPSSERVSTSVGPYMEDAGQHCDRGRIRTVLSSQVLEIRPGEVVLRKGDGSNETIANDNVFTMIGREAPLDFFRRSGVAIAGEWTTKSIMGLALFLLFCVWMYHWKSGGSVTAAFQARELFPFMFGRASDPSSLTGTIAISMGSPGFWYTLAYCLCVVIFGFRRMRRTPTPYVRVQTWTLMAIQCLPLFLLPYVLLPWAGHNGMFGRRHDVVAMTKDQVAQIEPLLANREPGRLPEGEANRIAMMLPDPVRTWTDPLIELSWGNRLLVSSASPGASTNSAIVRLSDRRMHVRDDELAASSIADQLFPASEWDPHGREYWRAFGFVLAWPLFVWNVFTERPMMLWLIIGAVQTLVLIPLMIRIWGKGSYCGWICSCGALAETLGDDQRAKMPHGPVWNRLNMTGQVVLAVALVLLGLRVAGWFLPYDHFVSKLFHGALEGKSVSGAALPFPWSYLNYKWVVDLFLAGILGVGLYFHFSGRVWCRFACPLAALMHIYARFSSFAIVADKKKCISCNVCTSVCHQGIDIMNFANKGMPMRDPECVRCSACVHSCPTGVLTFGRVDATGRALALDKIPASPVQMREGTSK